VRPFEKAERIHHNKLLGDMDEWERAHWELTARFEQAIEARKQLHVVEPEGEPHHDGD
jgi:uncharacterized protein YaiL (DUF2058 family)